MEVHSVCLLFIDLCIIMCPYLSDVSLNCIFTVITFTLYSLVGFDALS